MKTPIAVAFAGCVLSGCSLGASEITAEDVKPYLAPYKLGRPIIEPSGEPGAFDELGVDHPKVFVHNGRFYLSYIGYDGVGYQSALAVSDDLIHWKKLGLFFRRGDSTNAWDRLGRVVSGYVSVSDFRENTELLRKDGRYWLTYHAYPEQGYEGGGAANGLAWAESPDSLEWHCCDQPIFEKNPEPGRWDSGGLYSAQILRMRDGWKLCYSGKEKVGWPWHEQSSFADPVDDTFLHWKRRDAPPAMKTGEYPWCSRFCGGIDIRFDRATNRFVGYFMGFDGRHCGMGIRFSEDGEHYRAYSEMILKPGPKGSLDETHAHKIAHAWLNGDLYLIYCSVRPLRTDEEKRRFRKKGWNEFRSLTIARSRPW